MCEHFTDSARTVIHLAGQEARRFNHEYIPTQHILLALVKESSGVLNDLKIDRRKVRLEVERIVLTGPDDAVTLWNLPQTPRAKNVINYAVEEASNLNRSCVGTEHLLLGLLRETESVAAQVLLKLGLTLEDVRQDVLNLGPAGAGVSDGDPGPRFRITSVMSCLSDICKGEP
jgi:ATP-dependent Clp protease ATP-binding subunit ClpC